MTVGGQPNTEPVRFFLTGPTYVRPDVLAATARQPIGHRSAEFRELYATLGPRLKQVFRTERDVYVATSSSTMLMQAALASLVAPGEKILALTCGAFSERWLAIAASLGIEADACKAPWGKANDPEALRRKLAGGRYAAVTVAHSETSTGVMNPIASLARVVHDESAALFLVDTVSSLAGIPVETDAWGLDLVLAGSQKALALPPGLALFSFSERAADRAARLDHRGFYTDLLRYRDLDRRGGTITTPAVTLIYALDRQLQVILDEGMTARWERHRMLRAQTEVWAATHGFEYASAAGAGSWTVSCLQPPAGVRPAALVEALAGQGFVVAPGYGSWKETTFRIGHMGEVGSRDLATLLSHTQKLAIDLGSTAP